MRNGNARDKSAVVSEIPAACADEWAALDFLERQRWGDNFACPRCGSVNAYRMTDSKTGGREKHGRCRCRDCKRQFSVRTGTVLEDSRIPLRHWCYAFWAACSSKKGVSALQIKRMTGLTYKSALFLMHRIRWAMAVAAPPRPLTGTVEADETYVGGKPRYGQGQRHARKISKKGVVVAVIERGGHVRATHLPVVNAKSLAKFVDANVRKDARLITDESQLYTAPGATFEGGHETIRHSAREYARGDVTTNTVEGFFALLKRGIYGTFHNVSHRHLHRYVSEFEFRHNTRFLEDGARTVAAIKGAEGKRLRYRQPTP